MPGCFSKKAIRYDTIKKTATTRYGTCVFQSNNMPDIIGPTIFPMLVKDIFKPLIKPWSDSLALVKSVVMAGRKRSNAEKIINVATITSNFVWACVIQMVQIAARKKQRRITRRSPHLLTMVSNNATCKNSEINPFRVNTKAILLRLKLKTSLT